MNIPPAIIAASIAGGGAGIAAGFMTKGENAENAGLSAWNQFGEASAGSFKYGFVGAGIGAGATGTAMAIKSILRK